MKNILLLSLFPLLFFSCSHFSSQEDSDAENETRATDRLTFLWETSPQLPTVESVIYDSVTQHLYTTNIDGPTTKKDGKGSISKLTLDGKIVDANWVSNIHAPTGLGIVDGKLYVTNIDEVLEVDMTTATILNTYPIEGAVALNDLTTGPDGTIYCSDTDGNTIYSLKNGVITKIMEDIESPNGLYVTEEQIFVVCWNTKSLYQLNPADKTLKTITEGIRGLDGLEPVGNGDYLVSSFFGKVYYVTKTGEKTVILDTVKKEISAADIEYIPEMKMLLVPTMDANKVMAYRLD